MSFTQLAFEDQFDRPELDIDRWLPLYLPQWSSIERSRPNYELRNQNLILQITKNQLPWCPEFDGQVKVSNLQTGVWSGPEGSRSGQHRFSQDLVVREAQQPRHTYLPQYGRIEICCKVPNLGIDNVAALWMIGYEDQPQRSAEICIVEIIGTNQPEKGAVIGYGLRPFADPKIQNEFFEDHFEIDIRDFHTFTVEWYPDHLDFFIDGHLTRTIGQSPDYPMQLMLNIYEVPVKGHDPAQNQYPREFVVDWVKGWE